MKRFWLFLSWLGATALVSFVTFQALSAAQGQVNDRPLTPVVVASTFQVGLDSTTTSAPLAVDPTERAAMMAETTSSTSHAGAAPVGEGSGSGSNTQQSPAVTASGTADTSPVTTTTIAGSSSTTGEGEDSATTTTTVAQPTTTVAAWTTATINSPGGSVTVSYRPGEVRYDAAVPSAGYTLDIEETGPEVRVEFDHDELPNYEIRARWNDGAFDSEVNEKG